LAVTAKHNKIDTLKRSLALEVLRLWLTKQLPGKHLRGKYHCTVDLLFEQFKNVRLFSTKLSAPCTNAHF